MTRTLAICDLEDWRAGGKRKEDFVAKMGEALQDIGFFALTGHGIDVQSIKKSYSVSEEFFHLPQEEKNRYENAELFRQRGYTPYGVEHAKDNPAPDLKEFWQTGRTIDDPDFHKNIWPDEPKEFENSIDGLYIAMESMSSELLAAASLYLNKPESWLPDMAHTKGGKALVGRSFGWTDIDWLWRSGYLAASQLWKSICRLWGHLYRHGYSLGLESGWHCARQI